MFLSLSSVFNYLNAGPGSRCFIEGEAVLNAGHLLICGIEEHIEENKWKIKAYCLQTSALKSADPHEVCGLLVVNGSTVAIEPFKCSCKAGVSGCCKHVAATLLQCTRTRVEELPQLSCTDTEFMWKSKRPRVEKQYDASPLYLSKCYSENKVMKDKDVSNRCKEIGEKLLKQALEVVPDSEYSSQFKGRRQQIDIATTNKSSDSPTIPSYVTSIFHNSMQSVTIKNIEDHISNLSNCCRNTLNAFSNDDILKAMCCEQGSQEWKLLRKNRITGSTCYSIFTFKKSDWTVKLKNFFNPTVVRTKEMRHWLAMLLKKIIRNMTLRKLEL